MSDGSRANRCKGRPQGGGLIIKHDLCSLIMFLQIPLIKDVKSLLMKGFGHA